MFLDRAIYISDHYPSQSNCLLLTFIRFAPTRWRGSMMAAVFSMQGAGQVAAALVTLVTTISFKESFISTTGDYSSCHEACIIAADKSWRIIVAFGAFPACFALYYRITIPETPRYTFDIDRDVEKAAADIQAYMNNQKEGTVDPVSQLKTKARMGPQLKSPPASWRDAWTYFSQWKNFKIIFATSSSWLLLDLAFYGLSLNNSIVLDIIGFAAGDSIYQNLRNIAIGNLVLVCAGSLPGYWLSVLTIDTLGRKSIQLIGFLLLTISKCICFSASFECRNATQRNVLIQPQYLRSSASLTMNCLLAPSSCSTSWHSSSSTLAPTPQLSSSPENVFPPATEVQVTASARQWEKSAPSSRK